MAWLYRYETNGIQSWILDSNRLRDLAGGSALIEALAERAGMEAERLGAEVIQSTSGSMTARFEDDEALASFAGEWPMVVAYAAPGLQLVQAWIRENGPMAPLFQKLAARRNRVCLADIEAGPWVLRAARSGLPSVPTPPDIRSAALKTALDPAALAKERSRAASLHRKDGVVTGGIPWAQFIHDVDCWKDEGPIAVVHADGTGVGKLLMGLAPAELKSFSVNLREATKAAICEAVQCLLHEGMVTARPVVCAGDDLTYIVPAAYGREFAAGWLRAFEQHTERLIGRKLVGGAGIAFVHRNFPFSRSYEMAEHLCKAAKKAFNGRSRSVLAFQRITTSLAMQVEDGAIAWSVDSNPLLDDLVDSARSLPRGTLRRWLERFERGDQVGAMQLWRRAREVAESKTPAAWARFENALEAAGGDPGNGGFRESGDGPTVALGATRPTPVRDALTLRHVEKRR